MVINIDSAQLLKVNSHPLSDWLLNYNSITIDALAQVESDIKERFNFYGGNYAYRDLLENLIGEWVFDELSLCCAKAKAVGDSAGHVFYEPMLCGHRRYCYRDMKVDSEKRGFNLFYVFGQFAGRFETFDNPYFAVSNFTITLPEVVRAELNNDYSKMRRFAYDCVDAFHKKYRGDDSYTAYAHVHLTHSKEPHRPFEHIEILIPNVSLTKHGVFRVFKPVLSKDELDGFRAIQIEKIKEYFGFDVDAVDFKYSYLYWFNDANRIRHKCNYIVRQPMLDFVENVEDVSNGIVTYRDESLHDMDKVLDSIRGLLDNVFGRKMGAWYGYLNNRSKRKIFSKLGKVFLPAWLLNKQVSALLRKCPRCGLDLKPHRGLDCMRVREIPMLSLLPYARVFYNRNNLMAFILNTSRFIRCGSVEKMCDDC